jgi:hypothetical protein
MRIVLIQHGGERVLGGCDTLDPRSVEFHKNALERVGPDELAVIAARWFDESEGQYYWDYRFAPFGPRDRKEGYDVFVCRYEADAAAKMRLQDFGVVATKCFYVGYVCRLPPVILIDYRQPRPSGVRADCCLFPVDVWT